MWGYPDAFMALVSADMTIAPADIERDHVVVLEAGSDLVGFYRSSRERDLAVLQDLFIDPDAVGQGHGRRLFLDAVEVARTWGCTIMELDSDPNAESFYRRMGAERVGMTASSLVPGRVLPRMRYRLDPGSQA